MDKVARGILDNDEDAADAMQDTILTCFEKIHTLKNPEYFKTWMIRILINECNKIHRHYKNFSRAEELPEVPGQDMSIEEFEFKEMLGMLDESYRIILVLYYVEGFRIADIASILNMNENTVKTRLVRARMQLKQEYSGFFSVCIFSKQVSMVSCMASAASSSLSRIPLATLYIAREFFSL